MKKKKENTKIIGVRIPMDVYKKLQDQADKESVGTVRDYGLKTTVSGLVRRFIIEKV